jgi:hypothetical protein
MIEFWQVLMFVGVASLTYAFFLSRRERHR